MRIVLLLVAVLAAAEARIYKLCAQKSMTEDDCNVLSKGSSSVMCVRVVDSAECAIKMARGEADFGIFRAEELLLAYQFHRSEILPIYQIRSRDRLNYTDEFQAVVVVDESLNVDGGNSTFSSLRHAGLCHPGFSKSQWWTDYILKYFEKKVYQLECQANLTSAENEAVNLVKFFGKGCRPGAWLADDHYSDYLKSKYPQLCSLCDDPRTCQYKNKENHGHSGALECLLDGYGKIAYAALTHVREHLNSNSTKFKFLCPDGSFEPLYYEKPCSWVKQPWPTVVSRIELREELTKNIQEWLDTKETYSSDSWTLAIKKYLEEEGNVFPIEQTGISDYFTGRTVDFVTPPKYCGNTTRWCTVSEKEQKKCEWVAKESLILGVEPNFVCKRAQDRFQCFRDIAANKADIITIDSNYGHLARQMYGLSPILFGDTPSTRYSKIVAAVRENTTYPLETVKSFKELRDKKACFPEYDGIAWISFIQTARSYKIISQKSCKYSHMMAKLFSGGSCTPGIKDSNYMNRTDVDSEVELLCKQCPSESNNATCSASSENSYYGDIGATKCLADNNASIIFVEVKNLDDATLNSDQFRVLCKNDSLANRVGFDVDDQCALSVTIDSEVISRRNNTKVDTLDMAFALMKLEDWLGYRLGTPRPIHLYDSFDGVKDLLFKDQTIGLLNVTSEDKPVQNYLELFSHVDKCSGAEFTISSLITITLTVLLSLILSS